MGSILLIADIHYIWTDWADCLFTLIKPLYFRAMPTLYEKVVSVIEKDIEDRNDFECQDLISWFRNKSSLFKTLKAGKLFILLNISVDIPCCVQMCWEVFFFFKEFCAEHNLNMRGQLSDYQKYKSLVKVSLSISSVQSSWKLILWA